MEGILEGTAKIFVEKLEIKNDKASAKLVQTFSTGVGINTSSKSILIRPFSKVLKTEKQIGKINFLLFKENDRFYLLGAFANTEKRIIFFPAMREHYITKQTTLTINNQTTNTMLQHISLESNLKNWHYKFIDSSNSDTKTERFTIPKLDNVFSLWFVWRFKSLENLEMLPKRHELIIKGNEQSVRRKINRMIEAIHNSVGSVLTCDDNSQNDFFWNLEFFISNSKKLDFPLIPVNCTTNDTCIITDNRIDVVTNAVQPIFIENFNGLIWVRIGKIIGTLKSDHVTTQPSQEYCDLIKKILTNN